MFQYGNLHLNSRSLVFDSDDEHVALLKMRYFHNLPGNFSELLSFNQMMKETHPQASNLGKKRGFQFRDGSFEEEHYA